MKILLINTPRAGSTTLVESIYQTMNLKQINSPFRDVIINHPKEIDWYRDNDNFILATRAHHTSSDFLIELTKVFDNIILLSRKNSLHAAESYAYVFDKFKENNNKFLAHRTRYVWEATDGLKSAKEKVSLSEQNLHRVSDECNLPIIYYEDLYYGDTQKILENMNIGIEYSKVSSYFNLGKKQRISNNITNLI